MAQPELKVQIAIIKWLRVVMPGVIVHHSVNEHGKRGKAGMFQAMRNKNAGMMPGFPDLIVLPYATAGPFFLEVKAPKGRVSETQKQAHELLKDRGYKVAVVRSVEETRAFMQANHIGFNEVLL